MAPVNRLVHGLAIAGTISTFYGLLRLMRQMRTRQALVDAALVSYGSGVAVMFASIASGFVATDIAAIVLEAGGDAPALYEPVRDFGWAFTRRAPGCSSSRRPWESDCGRWRCFATRHLDSR